MSHPACSLCLEKEAHEDGQEFIQGVHLGIAFAGAGLDLFLCWNTLHHVLSKGAREREAFGLQALIVLHREMSSAAELWYRWWYPGTGGGAVGADGRVVW